MTWASKIPIYLLVATGAVAALIGTTILLFDLPALAVSLAAAAVLGGFWFYKRVLREKAALPKTGFEIPLLLFFAGLALSLIFARTPRIGLERIGWFLLAAMLFYVLVDLFEQPEYRSAVRIVSIVVTIPIIFHALSETYARYLIWWEQSGIQGASPPFQIRFISLLNHSNIFMEVMNMIAPFAAVLFFTTKKRSIRLLCAFWLVSFFASIPFSSSRGGWLGTAGWVGLLFLWWIIDQGRWKSAWNLVRRYPIPSMAIAAVLGVIFIAGGLKFYWTFAGAHPTHGAATSLNREHLWDSAIQVWRQSPWIGSGLGRFGLATFQVMRGYPNGNAPAHAHSTPLQFLGETGLVGFIPFLILSLWALFLFIRAYRTAPPANRMWIAASIAALISAMIHGVFEDYTYRPILLFILVLHAALILGMGKPLRRIQNVSFGWFAVPGAALLLLAMFNIWSRAPLDSVAAQELEAIDWRAAAEAAAESQRRDPSMPFFSGQAGMAYAMAWQQYGEPEYLRTAQEYLLKAAAVEPDSSMLWANLAILRWYDGQPDLALEAMQRAIALCPTEVSFYLNYAWLLENTGQHAQAQAQYEKALAAAPGLADHPFWTSSADRKAAIKPFVLNADTPSGAHWQTALVHLTAGDALQARYELAVSDLFEEPFTYRTSARAAYAASDADPDDYLRALDSLVSALQYDYWGTNIGGGIYSLYFMRSGFPMSVVPGYIRVIPDAGQIDHLRALVDLQITTNQCKDAAYTWQILQRELQAGVLPEGGYPALPACPTVQ